MAIQFIIITIKNRPFTDWSAVLQNTRLPGAPRRVHVRDFVRRPRRRPKKRSSGLAVVVAIAAGIYAVGQLNKSDSPSEPAKAETACVVPVKDAFLIPEGMWTAHRRNNSGPYPHRGLDIMQKTGTEIRAVKAGEIIFSGYRNPDDKEEGHGQIVYIKHSDGWTALYAHMDSIAIEVTQSPDKTVEKGQVIGTVGHTGNASANAPHLHLEIGEPGDKRGARKYSDPQKWLHECGGWDPNWVEHKPK
ncbi:MAG TPA: M23 family metallopeptidase [Candidatus Saccharimonadales bacterium]|nr:M23 family metallopeptidase [Candidatus Saccharimonadales bacterium]